MRIALINEKWVAGPNRSVQSLAEGLRRQHEVLVLPNPTITDTAGLMRALYAFAPDVVHMHAFYGSFSYDTLNLIAENFPCVFTPHDTRPVGKMDPRCYTCENFRYCWACPILREEGSRLAIFHQLTTLAQRWRKRRAHNRLPPETRIIAVSQWLKRRMERTEIQRLQITHIPNGIDLNRFRPNPDARKTLGLNPSDHIVLFAAHFNRFWIPNAFKGLPVLGEAFLKVVIPQMPATKLFVAGEALAPNLPNTVPLGEIPNNRLPLYYAAADIVAVPSIADNLPYTIMEAMACGTPVIASDVGGIPEMVHHGKNGLLVPPKNAEALGNAITQLLSNPDLRSKCGVAARNTTEQQYSMRQCLQRHERIYQEMCQL
jgi:glycosyltransferase involved in cell wall biosynthesis